MSFRTFLYYELEKKIQLLNTLSNWWIHWNATALYGKPSLAIQVALELVTRDYLLKNGLIIINEHFEATARSNCFPYACWSISFVEKTSNLALSETRDDLHCTLQKDPVINPWFCPIHTCDQRYAARCNEAYRKDKKYSELTAWGRSVGPKEHILLLKNQHRIQNASPVMKSGG